jgi:hypothetical protein
MAHSNARWVFLSLPFVVLMACGGSSSKSGLGGSSSTAGTTTTTGGSGDGGCVWAGNWSAKADPAGFTSGDCTNAPPVPDLTIGADGSLAVYDNGTTTPCEAVSPSVATCQTFGICQPWEVTINFRACTAGQPCQAGLVSVFEGQGDGGPCAVAIVLTPIP